MNLHDSVSSSSLCLGSVDGPGPPNKRIDIYFIDLKRALLRQSVDRDRADGNEAWTPARERAGNAGSLPLLSTAHGLSRVGLRVTELL